MKTLIQERSGKWCSKRLLSLLFGLAAIVGAFVGLEKDIVIVFAGLSMGHSALTTKQFENQ